MTRVVLLAPTVQCAYDLRRALSASCEGIDSFYSRQDSTLETAINMFGTTDIGKRNKTSAAGLYGFVPRVYCPADAAIYAKLRQHNQKNFGSSSPFGDEECYSSRLFLQTELIPLFGSALYYTPIPAPADLCSADVADAAAARSLASAARQDSWPPPPSMMSIAPVPAIPIRDVVP